MTIFFNMLIVGEGSSDIHEIALAKAFEDLGHTVKKFFISEYYGPNGERLSVVKKLQRRIHCGPLVNKINSELLGCVEDGSFDIIFIYRGIDIYPETIRKIRDMAKGAKLISYNNDNAFSSGYYWWEWRHYIESIKYFNCVCVYRESNIEDVTRLGAGSVKLLRSWYIPWVDMPPVNISQEDIRDFTSDVVFVGHFENDGRREALEKLIADNIDVRVFGPYHGLGKSGWAGKIAPNSNLSKIEPFTYLKGEDYRKAIFLSGISLCFLSKLNNDTYTRRCFEIPAIGGALFSEYSDDLSNLYVEGVEAEFFRSHDELLDKVSFYLSNPSILKDLKVRGGEAVRRNKHDIVSRAKELIGVIA